MTLAVSSDTPSLRRFLRAVHLLHDRGDRNRFAGYVLTEQALKVVTAVLRGIAQPDGNRAWTITGPYGTGKSACALFLSDLVSDVSLAPGSAAAHLHERYPRIYADLQSEGLLSGYLPLLPVLVVGSQQSPRVAIAAGLQRALLPFAKVHPAATTALDAAQRVENGTQLVSAVERAHAASQHLGYRGLLLVIDELGRLLSYAASSPDDGDIQVLQDLAELAQRSAEQPLVLIGVLHQAFAQYAARFDSAQRDTWAKVQGRFEDLAFLEPPAQLLRLLAEAVTQYRLDLPATRRVEVRVAAEQALTAGAAPPGMAAEEFIALATRAAPLHPVAFVALPYLFRRFAQNERSLFSYLASLEPFGFRELAAQDCLITLADVFDYVEANFGAAVAAQYRGRRWAEAFDLLTRAGWTDAEQRVLKTVATLAVLGDYCHLRPTEDLIVAGLTATPEHAEAVRATLAQLTRRAVLTFRRFSRTYHVWDGSDIDLEERLAAARAEVATDTRLAELLNRYLPPRPLIARRHSHMTGALRYFEARYVDRMLTSDELPQPDPAVGADGFVLYCLPAAPGDVSRWEEWAVSTTAARADLIVAVTRRIGRLLDVAIELRALHHVRETLPELRDDAVARRELAARIGEVETAIAQAVDLALEPSTVRWVYAGVGHDTVRRPADVARLVSEVADRLYCATPVLRNELVNRRALSSAAAAGRRNLIEAMLTRPNEPRLGITGFPPEASIYASVLQTTGLHRCRAEGEAWGFLPPSAEDPGHIRPVWQALEQLVFRPLPELVAVHEIGATLARPPYGVLPGVFPILLTAFLLTHEGEVALYREGAFVPEPSIADFEVLLRRPELFAVAGFHIRGARLAVLTRFGRGLGVTPTVVPVVRALLRTVRQAPEHARRTRRVAPTTLAVREVCERTTSPERFLFVELPTALGLAPFDDSPVETDPYTGTVDEFFRRLNAALAELASVTQRVIEQVRDSLLLAAGLEAGPEGWTRLRALAVELAPRINDPTVATFLRRCAADNPLDDEAALQSALAILLNRPPRVWTDADADLALQRAQDIGSAVTILLNQHLPYNTTPLTLAEQQEKTVLAARLRTILADQRHSPHVVRAALLELLHGLSPQPTSSSEGVTP